jgi:antagonist of KipI
VSGFSRTGELRLKTDTTFTAGPTQRAITVVSPGLFTTVQDRGRWGHQASGVPVAGPMDIVSHDAANGALGNDVNAATLEVTLGGPELRVEDDAWVVVTGADLSATLDGSSLAAGEPRLARAGSVVRFGERRRGARAYLAVDGGIATPVVLGSRSTHVTGGLGRALKAGDRLALSPQSQGSRRPGLPAALPAGGARLRLRRGPQCDRASEETFEVLQRSRFAVGSHSNRMAYRLTGPRLPLLPAGEMISDATFIGAIQVPPSGEPILLMADRQTTGGYPQVATLVAADVPLAGQLAPGDWIEFALRDDDGGG